jgi:hypothetical protein
MLSTKQDLYLFVELLKRTTWLQISRYNIDKRPLTKNEFSELLLKLISEGVKQEEIDLVQILLLNVTYVNELVTVNTGLFLLYSQLQ